jgi:RNA polymerase sporulation-specific sigma factor
MFKKLLDKLVSLFKLSSTTYYITGSENLLPPLSKEEEDKLVEIYNNTGDLEARNSLIEHNLRLVVYVAKKFDSNINNLEDLISIGTLGLIKAINTYKLDKNIKLATYASRCIENEILMHLRKYQRTKLEVSLDEPLKADYDGNELLLQDILQDNSISIFEEIDSKEDASNLEDALTILNDREKEIIELRYGLNGKVELTQKETAELLGISQSYISRLEKKILKKLHQTIKK